MEDGKKVRWGMPACLAKQPPPAPPALPAAPDRQISVTQAQWLEWHRQQTGALAAAEMKAAAARDPSPGLHRGPARDPTTPPTPCASSALADGSADMGAPPPLLEERFVDRAALPKGITFDPTVVPTVSIDSGSPGGCGSLEVDAEMHDGELDAEEYAGGQRDDEDAVDGGSPTPVWPPADATLDQLEDWLDSLRRLPEDEGIMARQDLLASSPYVTTSSRKRSCSRPRSLTLMPRSRRPSSSSRWRRTRSSSASAAMLPGCPREGCFLGCCGGRQRGCCPPGWP